MHASMMYAFTYASKCFCSGSDNIIGSLLIIWNVRNI